MHARTRSSKHHECPPDVIRGSFGSTRTLTGVPELHPSIAILAPLVGTWIGPGSGEYPTIDSFSYLEEVTFGHIGKPFLTYSQRTKAADDGKPMHAEVGYLRVPSPGRVEFVLAQPTGIAEIEEGTLAVEDGALQLELHSTSIGRTASAKNVTALARSVRAEGNELSYRVRMGAVGLPLQHHLSATLRKRSE